SLSGVKNIVINSEIIYTEVDGKYIYVITTHSPSFETVQILSDLSALLKSAGFSREEADFLQLQSLSPELELEWDERNWDIKLDNGLNFSSKEFSDLKLNIAT